MNARSKSSLSLLPLALCLAPLAGQDLERPAKPIAAYVADADQVVFQADPDANGCIVVLVALSDRMWKPAPFLPWLLADGEVYMVADWKSDADADAIALQALLGLEYYAQLVMLDATDATVRASKPVVVAWAEGDEPGQPAHWRKPVPMQPLLDATDDAKQHEGEIEPMEPQSIDELASQMKFWIDRQRGASYAKLRADFRTSSAGYSWVEATVREAADGTDGVDVHLVLATPSAPAHLLVEEHIQTSVALPMGTNGVRIFLGLARDDGVEPEFVLIREL